MLLAPDVTGSSGNPPEHSIAWFAKSIHQFLGIDA
jgi:hypothetical protein